MNENPFSLKQQIWTRFKKNKIALGALIFLSLVSLIGIYAPFFASSKPLFVRFEGKFFFPLFRYLFFSGFYTKPIDLFFNVFMIILPLTILGILILQKYRKKTVKLWILTCAGLQLLLTFCFAFGLVKNPERNLLLYHEKEKRLLPNFDEDLALFNDYQKLNLILRYVNQKKQKERLLSYIEKTNKPLSLLFDLNVRHEKEESQKLKQNILELEENYEKISAEFPSYLKTYLPYYHDLAIISALLREDKEDIFLKKRYDAALKEERQAKETIEQAENIIHKYRYAKARLLYLEKKNAWLRNSHLETQIQPLFRTFHWEEDAGGSQESNSHLPWWERTRLNRKDLASALIFGVRVSLIVGFSAVLISLAIGIPLGLFAGYFAAKVDMIVLRFIEIWEAMPTFFTLLLISAIFHNKSLFLTIIVLGIFGWTGFARFIRAESLRERGLAYVMASRSLGFGDSRIMFSHVLPNAISPVLALLPFSMMAAITSEAALSFLGLGEENSTSWGVLMSEARTVFPGESYLLWPPALLLTSFLVAIALVGDGLRDALDPKMQH